MRCHSFADGSPAEAGARGVRFRLPFLAWMLALQGGHSLQEGNPKETQEEILNFLKA